MGDDNTNRGTVETESEKTMMHVNVPVDLLVTTFGVGLMVLVGSYPVKHFRGAAPPREAYRTEQAEDEYVSFDINYVLDTFMESYRTHSGVRTRSSIYYLVLDEEAGTVPMRISDKMEAKMDRITDETWDYLKGVHSNPSQELHVEGTLKKLKGDGKKYYDRAVRSFDLETETEDYYLQAGTLDNQTPSSAMGTTGLGAVIAFLGLFILSSMLKKHRVAAVRTFLDNHKTMNRGRLDEDFRNTRKISGTFWIGEDLTYGIIGKPVILVNQELKKIRFQVKKIGRGTNTELVCVMADGKEYEFTINREDADEAIALYHAKFSTLKMASSLKGKFIVPEDGDTESNQSQ